MKLYTDEFQIINPLGNKARAHTICAVYFSLDDMTITVQLIVEFAKCVPGFETLKQNDQAHLPPHFDLAQEPVDTPCGGGHFPK